VSSSSGRTSTFDSSWQVIAKFWPILIIFWGLSKLVDYIQAQAHPETVPPPLFSASEVVLLVLILVMGTLISKIVLRPWQQWPASMGVDMDNEGFEGLFMNSYTYTQTFSHEVHPSLTSWSWTVVVTWRCMPPAKPRLTRW